MSSATKENSDADINCTSEMSLPGAMLSPSLTYDSISNKIHYPDGYFINSIYLKRNMASVDNDVATENKNLANGHSNCQIYNSGSSSDISSSNGNYNSSSLLKDVTDDTDDLKLSNDAPRKYGLSDLFNRAVSVFAPERKGWNLWNKPSTHSSEQKYSHVVASSTALIQQIRPSTLPAKDINEESRHKAEYDSILKEARIKEQKQLTAWQIEIKNRVKREDAQAKRIKQWQEILPKFSKLQNSQYVQSLWWHGLPPSVRGQVWLLAFGNELQLTHEDYYSNMCKASIKIALNLGCSVDDIIKISHDAQDDKIYQLFSANANIHLINKESLNSSESAIKVTNIYGNQCIDSCQTNNAHRFSFCDRTNCECNDNNHSSEKSSDSCLNVIQLDISRTFPSLGVFQKGCPYFPILHALLASYVTYKPNIGYVQGMSFIAAVLLVNMEPPNAFITFCNILEKPLHSAAFSLDQRKLEAYFRAYDDLFSNCLPELHAHFVELGLTAELYCVDWLYSVFSRAMPFDIACRVWDLFARDGEEALFQTAIGILTYFQTTLIEMDFISAAQFLTKLPENIDQENLFRIIRKVPLKVGQMTFTKLLSNYKGHV